MSFALLVTGGAGFIGSHVVRALLGNQKFCKSQIIILDDLSGGFKDNIPEDERILFIEGSVMDYKLVDSLFCKYRFRFVYHLAAYAAEGLSHFIRQFNYNNNLIGSINLINASVNFGTECFIFTSSIAVYGAGQVPMHEEMSPAPEDPYGIAKFAVELDLKNAHRMFGLDFIIFRPHNVYGEFQNIGDRYRNVIGIFMNQILKGEPMTIYGDGEQVRAFSYVGDLSPFIAGAPLVENARNRIFNIGADNPYTVKELALRVSEAMGMKAEINYLPHRDEVLVAYADHTACKETFGMQTVVSLPQGLERMAAWVKKAGARTSCEFSNIEVTKKLPEVWVR